MINLVCVHMYVMMCMQKSEGKLWEFILSFHHVGSRDRIGMAGLAVHSLYLLSHVACLYEGLI